MEIISATPDFLDVVNVWAKANPFESFIFGTISLMAICYFTKDWI